MIPHHNLPDFLVEQNWGVHDLQSGTYCSIYQYKKNMLNETTYKIQLSKHVFIYLMQGQKEVVHYSKKVVLSAGELMVLRKGTYVINELQADPQYGYRAVLFFFDRLPEGRIPLYATAAPAGVSYLYKTAPHDLLQGYYELLTAYANQYSRENFKRLLAIKLNELLVLLRNVDPNILPFFSSLARSEAFSMKRFLEQTYQEQQNLEERASLAGMSVTTFKRQVKKELGTSPLKWIYERRLLEAYKLLTSTSKNANEIAFQVGFGNPSHFSKLFKKRFGCSPLKIREQFKEK